jgi:ketosteroid isomerase-like protein
MKRFLITLALLASFGSAMAAGQAAPRGHGAPVPTRNIMIFTKLENDWFDAIQRHDEQAIGRYVTDDFEIRSAPTPGVPTARDEAMRQWTQMPATHAAVKQMAVHEYGDLMLVSFLWTLGEGASAQSFFVVDTWKRVGTDWRVAVRYAAPVGSSGASVPGTVPASDQSLRKKM